MNRFHVRYVFLLAKESFRKNIHCNIEGWEQHLGLEHTATTPKMSYLGNNQSNYKTTILLRSLRGFTTKAGNTFYM
ncbi:hypothetical protein ZEAMMB73_Zm00001d025297 [Zea mays]|uniref:Uncharacterized protein n=1 Tax=Zea mays TaxID=4577 RepID=A0A1D6J6C4_MAIZE|nr:hypothetical protein ZEAMMB73_Zm00001d025297 [Zea mays]